MITVHPTAGERRIIRTGDGFTAVYAGADYDAPVRLNELYAAIVLIEIIELREGPLMVIMATEALRYELSKLGYTL